MDEMERQNGYGNYRWGKEQRANRIAWILTNGDIEKGLQVLHKCDNPPCCNPNHLFLGTENDNVQDMIRKGRLTVPRGEECEHSKLIEKEVLEIRKLHEGGMVQRRIAEKFSVGYKAISKIVLRQRWKHI